MHEPATLTLDLTPAPDVEPIAKRVADVLREVEVRGFTVAQVRVSLVPVPGSVPDVMRLRRG
jgi:hypothetical protein